MNAKLKLASNLSFPIEIAGQTIALFGIRGSGKTNTAGALAEELLDHHQPIAVIDPTDAWWGNNILDTPSGRVEDSRVRSLWSILDIMHKFAALELSQNLCQLRSFETTCLITNVSNPDKRVKLSQKMMARIIKQVQACNSLCQRVGFIDSSEKTGSSLSFFQSHGEKVDDSSVGAELRNIIESIFAEMKKHNFVHVLEDRSAYFEQSGLFGKEVDTAFPSASEDIHEAGNCLAVECNSAAVFHLMRVAEYGLRALAYDRRIDIPKNKPIELATWEDIIHQLEDAEDQIRNYPKTTAREAQYVFYHGAMMEFKRFKNKFRNRIMHTRETSYDRDEALSAYNHVRDFMQILSARISEGNRTPKIWKGSKWTI